MIHILCSIGRYVMKDFLVAINSYTETIVSEKEICSEVKVEKTSEKSWSMSLSLQ